MGSLYPQNLSVMTSVDCVARTSGRMVAPVISVESAQYSPSPAGRSSLISRIAEHKIIFQQDIQIVSHQQLDGLIWIINSTTENHSIYICSKHLIYYYLTWYRQRIWQLYCWWQWWCAAETLVSGCCWSKPGGHRSWTDPSSSSSSPTCSPSQYRRCLPTKVLGFILDVNWVLIPSWFPDF